MRTNQAGELSELVSAARAIADETLALFGHLTAIQLNWKPGEDQWSIAQCFDHLVTANASYGLIFDRVLRGEKKNRFWESLPWLPAFWGRMVIRAVAPDNKRKRKAPKIFRPTSSGVDEGIIRRFIDQQDLIVNYIGAFEDLDLGKIIISSPVSSLITYSLMDSFRIIITHERRHVLQAIEVAEMDEFPTARNMV